jgi:hypothetical protein
MLNSDTLEVATGLVFIYLLLSLATSSMRESLEAILKQRGRALEQGLIEMLGDKDGRLGLLKSFYDHPLIYGLYRGDYAPPNAKAGLTAEAMANHQAIRKSTVRKLPSYIPASSFALAVIDLAAGGAVSPIPLTVERIARGVEAMPSGGLKDALRLAVETSQNDVAKLQAFVETWYNSGMDRVSGAYRRHTQAIIFVFSLIACLVVNVNTVVITEALSQNLTLRQTVVAQADAVARQAPPGVDAKLKDQIDQIKETGLPIGWGGDALRRTQAHLRGSFPAVIMGALELFCGWVLTAVAITLGAPFWFDVLNKIMVVRSTVKPAEKSGQEASKDPVPAKTQASSMGASIVAGGAGSPPSVSAVSPPSTPAAAVAPPVDPRDQDEIMALDPSVRPREEV